MKTFSDNIPMKFGLDKCNELTIIKGYQMLSNNIALHSEEELEDLDINKQYRYIQDSMKEI